MILYSENPNLNKKKIIDIHGNIEYRINCRFINKEYYLINKDVFFIENKWYRLNSGYIVFDEETKQYVLKSKCINGVIGITLPSHPINLENNPVTYNVKDLKLFNTLYNSTQNVYYNKDNLFSLELKYGYFTPNPYKNVIFKTNGYEYIAINCEILKQNNFIECPGTDYWGRKEEGYGILDKSKSYTSYPYSAEDNPSEFEDKIKFYNNYPISLSKDVRKYAKLLGDTTYGVEIETTYGYVPKYIQNRHGLMICRDGSIDGGAEYVSVPLSKAKGLQTLANITQEIDKRCLHNIKCSLHIHFGNVNTDRLSIVATYVLFYKIQNELYKCFPYYKTNSKGIKNKTYSAKLPRLFYGLNSKGRDDYKSYVNDSYNKIFAYFGENGYPSSQCNRKQKKHPIKRKWDIHSRHVGLNFCNILFSNRNTYEFRLHENTTNSQKVINWLFVSNAILKYADVHSLDIITTAESISLETVLNYYSKSFPNNEYAKLLSEYLIAYMNYRKDYFQKDYLKKDFVSNEWTKNDKDFEFNHKGITYLF